MRISSGGLPAAAASPTSTGRDMPSTTNTSPTSPTSSMRGARSRNALSMKSL